jgi:hypothetical protein
MEWRMFDTAIIELLIGLVFIFSLMAILVTQVNTLITNARNWRAKNLKESLQDLVGDKQLQAEILVHPLIKLVDPEQIALMSLSVGDDMADSVLNARLTRVADIAPNTFVEAIVSILTVRAYGAIDRAARALPEEEPKRRILALLGDLQASPSDERLAALRQAIQGLAPSPAVTVLLNAFNELQEGFAAIRTRNPELLPLLIGVSRIQTPPFREAMQVILYSVPDMPTAMLKLQAWFNDGMQRSSAMFREKLQKWSLVVASVLVVLMNVDTLSIAQNLWEDHDLRASLAASASANARYPVAVDPDTGEPEAISTDLIQDAIRAQQTAQKLVALNVPLGWSHVPLTPEMAQNAATVGLPDPYGDTNNLWNLAPWSGNPSWLSLLIAKLIGLAASAIAAAQGAPFWFDLLQKIAGRRGD